MRDYTVSSHPRTCAVIGDHSVVCVVIGQSLLFHIVCAQHYGNQAWGGYTIAFTCEIHSLKN